MADGDATTLTRREAAKKVFNLATGTIHSISLRPLSAQVLDVEDAHFHLDSAVMLPDFGDCAAPADASDQNHVSGLAVLRAVYLHAQANPKQKLLVAGHADRSGADAYNLTLSHQRADNVLHLLLGERAEWVAICDKKHKVEDYQQILRFVDAQWGWGCDPGPATRTKNAKTTEAVRTFQKSYNAGAPHLPAGFTANLAVDGDVGPQTWGAFFDVYLRMLEELMQTDAAGLAAQRSSLAFVAAQRTVGCGENHPLTANAIENRQSQIDRRVEVLFFDPGEEPNLDCHPAKGKCVADACEIYRKKLYKLAPIPCTPVPVPPTKLNLLHLHIDADRDGQVDLDWKDNGAWEAGAGKKGAVILCNNDDEDRDKRVDNSNDKVDTAADIPDLAPLVLRKEIKGRPCPGGWKAVLSVDDPTKIRIFDKRADGGKEVIGPSAGGRFEIKDLSPDEITLAMEATQYPDATFDGMITITLEFQDSAGATKNTEKAKVRAAAWVMFHHLDPTDTVYVVDTGDNAAFMTELAAAVAAGGVAAPRRAARATYGSDRWMQDVMEIGFSASTASPLKDDWQLPVVLRTGNDRAAMNWGDTDKYPRNEMLGPGLGYVEALAPTTGSSLDSFGNLECSPPVTVGGKEYKFGRIIYGGGGREMLADVTAFLLAQKVQSPFKIDTDWLIVGHVDEVLSFFPTKSSSKGFKVLLASPQRAVDILRDVQSRGHGSAKLFGGIRFGAGFTRASLDRDYPKQSVDDILADVGGLMAAQTFVQAKIDGVKATLAAELGLTDADFIRLPVLFTREINRFTGAPGRCIAYSPGVVNMLVVTRADGTASLCVPKPFGPKVGGQCEFEKVIEQELGPPGTTGATAHFVDDFVPYHVLSGEIHCGTNSKRKPARDRWWWEQDGV